MSHSWHRVLSCFLLFYMLPLIALADNEVTIDEESSVSDSVSTDTIAEDATKQEDEAASDSAKQSETIIDKQSDSDEEKKTAILYVEVMQNGQVDQPIKDARVIITYEDATEYEQKTDASGKALLSGLPYGKVDVDVTSSGRQSDGGTFVLDEPNETLTFHLKPRAPSR